MIYAPTVISNLSLFENNLANSFDAHGNQCKLQTYTAYPCPQLCVRDISMCPPSNRPPTCPSGTTYCVDGKCRETCSDSLVSLCACPGAPDLVGAIYSCGDNNLRANIEDFVVEKKAAQSAEACNKAANIQNIPTWSNNPESAMWHECPAPDYGALTYTEDVFIALYAFYGSCLFTLLFWILYKKSKERVSWLVRGLGCQACYN